MDEENEDSKYWEIDSEAVKTIGKQLSNDCDDITRYYAVKTIENITAQSMKAGLLFSKEEFALSLLEIYNTTENEGLKISAAVSISHICKINNSIFMIVFEEMTCQNYCTLLLEGPQRVQQAFITMLNIALTGTSNNLNYILMEEPRFKEAMSNMLENSNPVIKGKSILTILLLFKMDPHWMVLVDEFKFYTI